MPPKKTPNLKDVYGALRYTFGLTDIAVMLLLGVKYQPAFAIL
jgi:hypothetical protein